SRSVAHLPDAVVGVPPAGADDVGEPGEESPVLGGEAAARLGVEISGLEDLPIGVELHLLDGAVADPDRRRSPVPDEVGELPLGEGAFAENPVHDLQVLRAAGSGPLEPGLELVGLVAKAEHEERNEREGGVPYPG